MALDRRPQFPPGFLPWVPILALLAGHAALFGGWLIDDAGAERLGLGQASVLLPDVGAPLYWSKLRIHDLAGLVDRRIARTLKKEPQAFHDYVFTELRPTFISSHGYWAMVARFDDDPRFRTHYVPLVEAQDAYATRHSGHPVRSRDYLRRDVAVVRRGVVARIRGELGYGSP